MAQLIGFVAALQQLADEGFTSVSFYGAGVLFDLEPHLARYKRIGTAFFPPQVQIEYAEGGQVAWILDPSGDDIQVTATRNVLCPDCGQPVTAADIDRGNYTENGERHNACSTPHSVEADRSTRIVQPA